MLIRGSAWVLRYTSRLATLERVGLDEFAARLDEVAHQGREGFLGEVGVADPHLEQRAGFRVERRFPELLGVHLAEPFVAL